MARTIWSRMPLGTTHWRLCDVFARVLVYSSCILLSLRRLLEVKSKCGGCTEYPISLSVFFPFSGFLLKFLPVSK